jgi:hypothetical protein
LILSPTFGEKYEKGRKNKKIKMDEKRKRKENR